MLLVNRFDQLPESSESAGRREFLFCAVLFSRNRQSASINLPAERERESLLLLAAGHLSFSLAHLVLPTNRLLSTAPELCSAPYRLVATTCRLEGIRVLVGHCAPTVLDEGGSKSARMKRKRFILIIECARQANRQSLIDFSIRVVVVVARTADRAQ